MPVWWIGKGKVLQEKKTSHGEHGGMVIITGKETGTEKNWKPGNDINKNTQAKICI